MAVRSWHHFHRSTPCTKRRWHARFALIFDSVGVRSSYLNQMNFSQITLLKFNRFENFCLSFEKSRSEIFSAKLSSGGGTFFEKSAKFFDPRKNIFQNNREIIKTSKIESMELVGVPRYQVCLLTPPNRKVRAHWSCPVAPKIKNGDLKVPAEDRILSKSAKSWKTRFLVGMVRVKLESWYLVVL